MNETKPQLELTFDPSADLRPRSQRQHQRRTQRARWWFDRMRHVVDLALDRRPAVAPRPEQIYFPLGRKTQID